MPLVLISALGSDLNINHYFLQDLNYNASDLNSCMIVTCLT